MAKVKVSVTIEQSVLERVDRLSNGISRSEIVGNALKRWLHDQRRQTLEDEVAAYYQDRPAEEVTEDREWAEHSARQTGKTWN